MSRPRTARQSPRRLGRHAGHHDRGGDVAVSPLRRDRGRLAVTDFPSSPTQPLRYAHVAFVLVLCFLLFPMAARFRNRIRWWDVVAGIAAVGDPDLCHRGRRRFHRPRHHADQLDVVLGVIFIVLLLEATRRTTGWIMPCVGVRSSPTPISGRICRRRGRIAATTSSQLVGHLFITLEGIFGVPVDVSSSLIILFTIYGAFLQHSGAGKFFIDFSMALMGGKPNSAGRTVVLSSFLLGGPSGSGVATTVTIGAVAYPMMQRAGFEKNAAGGLLAAGGLGAIISPPVLGAAAFLIAEFLKISYLDVIWMATIPTCLYYLSLLFMVELDAKRFGAHTVALRASADAVADDQALRLPLHLAGRRSSSSCCGAIRRCCRCSGRRC